MSDILFPSCALFLDFDGTLVDIAPQPEAVIVPSDLVATLDALNKYLGGALALISGRPIEQIDAFLHPLRLPAAGVHGAERRGADGADDAAVDPSVGARGRGRRWRSPPAIRGLRVENKRGSVALHYRQAPELEQECLQAMQAAVEESPGLTLLRGKMVVEAKPGGASKGHAIEAFLQEPPFAGRSPGFRRRRHHRRGRLRHRAAAAGPGREGGRGRQRRLAAPGLPAAFRYQLQAAVAAKAGKVDA